MKLFILLLLLFLSLSLHAQTIVLKGKIMDSSDKFSLPGATLRLENTGRHTVSDGNGSFEFLGVPVGTYILTVQYMGYQVFKKEITASDEQQHLEILLNPIGRKLAEVHVIGDMAKGQAKGLNQQKNNINITNIISSDQVGRFPDQNIGDALKRVPGIAVQNDQGEARDLIVRGLAPELSSVTINGDRIPSAEGNNRNVQMDLIPSDMISSLEVNKTLTPDMDADAIGGSVNLVTRASPNKQRISATMSGGYAPIRERGLYNGSLIYGNRFLANKLGVVMSGTIQAQNYGSDNIEAIWSNADGRTGLSQMDIRHYDVQRIRRSFSLASDYEFDARNRIEINAIYNWRDDRENRYRTRYTNMTWNETLQSYTGRVRRQTKGGLDNSANKNTRLETQKVMNFSVRGEHLLSSSLDFDWAASYSKALEDRPNERYIQYQSPNNIQLDQDLTDPTRPLVLDNYHDYSLYTLHRLTENHNYTEEDEFGFKANIRFPINLIPQQKGRIRLGTRLRAKTKMRDNVFYRYTPIPPFSDMSTLPLIDISGNNFVPGSQYIPGSFVDRQFLGKLNLTNSDLFSEAADPSEFLAVNYHAKELIFANYFRWDQNISDRTAIIMGARMEWTKLDYTGNYVEIQEDRLEQISNKNDYLNVLPSITIKHQVTDDFIVRAAVTTGIARPNYYALAPFVNSMPEDRNIEAGNPNLRATFATNYDLMAENYFQNIGLVSAGIFYKRLKNFVYQYRDLNYTSEQFDSDFPNLPNPILDNDAGQWTFRQSRNGRAVDLYGVEIAFQRQLDFLPSKFLKGFGIYTNYTYIKSIAKGITITEGEDRTGLSLPKTAPQMFNGSLSWENQRFLARISSNFAAAYLDAIGSSSFEDIYYDKQFFLDANATFKIKPQLRVFAEATNLTNQPLRYFQGSEERMMKLEYYRARYTLGLKFDL